MDKQVSLTLQASESAVLQCAASIYAAYITAGQVTAEDGAEWREKAIQEAIALGTRVDRLVQSDSELPGIG